jgi:hypothetical protein
MGKIKGYQMDLEEEQAFEPVGPTTKRVTVTVDYTYTYEVSFDFDTNDDDALTALMAGIPIDEGVSGESQTVRDLAFDIERTFTFEG